jgi:hypothetical protein
LLTLATRCNDNLKKKIATFPESIKLEKQLREETKEASEKTPVETGAKAKIKAEEKRKEAEPVNVKQTPAHPPSKADKLEPAIGTKRNVTQAHMDDYKESNKRQKVDDVRDKSPSQRNVTQAHNEDYKDTNKRQKVDDVRDKSPS